MHGLHHIHKQGILHRDLKPSNILLHHVASDWVIKIADFGISKILERYGLIYISKAVNCDKAHDQKIKKKANTILM
mgnify:CR=1 FL=1